MIGLFRNVAAKERDPSVADKATMMGRKETTSDTTVQRDCSDLQKKDILGGATSFQFRVRSMETAAQRV